MIKSPKMSASHAKRNGKTSRTCNIFQAQFFPGRTKRQDEQNMLHLRGTSFFRSDETARRAGHARSSRHTFYKVGRLDGFKTDSKPWFELRNRYAWRPDEYKIMYFPSFERLLASGLNDIRPPPPLEDILRPINTILKRWIWPFPLAAGELCNFSKTAWSRRLEPVKVFRTFRTLQNS
jgi:hypothetical protein